MNPVRKSIAAAWIAILGAAVLPGLAAAYSGGVDSLVASPEDPTRAREGCDIGGCHGSGTSPSPTTRIVILGLPAACSLVTPDGCAPGAATGYVSGQVYPIQLMVLGATVQIGASPGVPYAGFDLEVTAGTLSSPDGSALVLNRTECSWVSRQTGCFPASSCKVLVDPACPAPTFDAINNPSCKRCPGGTAACRPCDNLVVVGPIEATHAVFLKRGGPWNLAWTAPSEGSGDVDFLVAGNMTNGNGLPDAGDIWNLLGEDSPTDPVITVSPVTP
ncbi:MAG: hypothetical protein ACREQ9_11045 [Candidatus Binatia bacterium]